MIIEELVFWFVQNNRNLKNSNYRSLYFENKFDKIQARIIVNDSSWLPDSNITSLARSEGFRWIAVTALGKK